jgi:hypothetical protein
MSSDGNWWDPYCPCRVTRKNIVMTCLAIGCFALVTWTIYATGQHDSDGVENNVTYVYVDDTKSLLNLNFTLSSIKAVKLATDFNEKKVAAINAVADKMEEDRKTTLRIIKNPTDRVLCKCMCDLSVTSEEMVEAMKFIVQERLNSANDTLSDVPGVTPSTTTERPTTTTPTRPPSPDWR